MAYKGILKRHSGVFEIAQRLIDWTVVGGSAWIAHRYYLGAWPLPDAYLVAIGVGLILSAWMFPHFSVYEPWRGASMFEEARRMTIAWATVLLVLVTFAFATKSGPEFSRVWFSLWAAGAWVALLTGRALLRTALRWARRAGYNLRHIVIAGSAELGGEIAARIAHAPWAGLEIAGVFADGGEAASSKLRILGKLDDLPGYLQGGGIDQVWIALPLRDEDKLRHILHELRHLTVDIRYVPDIYGLRLINHSITEIAGLPVLDLSSSPMTGVNRLLKAIEDRLLALAILLLISPLLLALAVGVKLSSRGPVFFRQERVGWNGQPFMMLKFRSMPVDAESKSGPVWAKPGENRATPFGAFLRRTSLDELPQFINVLRGEMSIVGPRPERPVFVDKFKDEIPDYMKKHLVKAGITGWAQVNGWRGDTDLAKRIEYDLYYIERWSLWLDLRIILLTVFKGFVNPNAY